MDSSGRLLKKAFVAMLIANGLSMVFTILCFLIDSVVIGRFLGTDAASAAGLVQPVTLLINTLGMLLGPGITVICTRYIGKAQPERVNQVFSIVMIAVVIAFFLLSLGMFLAAPAIAELIGKGAGDEIVLMTSDYLQGFSLGLIPTRLCMCLMGLMMIDNDQKIAILSMLVTLITDVVFDLLNVMVFHGGMWGMALATSLSQLFGLMTILIHFLKKDRVLHFTTKGLRGSDLKEVVLYGVPNMISMGGQAIRSLCFNAFLLSIAGSSAVAALYVSSSAVSILMTVMLGLFLTSTTMSSLLMGEEDRNGLVECTKFGVRISVIVYTVFAVLLLFAAHPIAGLFLKSGVEEDLLQSARFIRVLGLQTLFLAMSQCLSGAYQGMRLLKLNYFISVMREGILPLACSLLLGLLFKMRGFEIGFVVSGVLCVLLFVVIAWVKNRRFPTSVQELLMIPEDFGAKPEELYESSMQTMEDVMKTSREVMEFCMARHADKRTASLLSLFVEEMAGNTVNHGFTKKRGGSVELRLVYREDSQVIRFRDDGEPFDPVKWLERNHPEDPLSGAGIRIIVKLASEVRYIPAMGLNNLMIRL